MPRTPRPLAADTLYHVTTRGNRKKRVFHNPRDYRAFIDLMRQAVERTPIRLVAFCLMPNHIHCLLMPLADGDGSRWMHWLLTTHASRYNKRHELTGHVWQARFKAFPVQLDEHFLTVLRYIERNPVRARLVDRAELWRWSSLGLLVAGAGGGLLADPPIPRPSNWIDYVNTPQTAEELEAVRTCVRRQSPYGDSAWTERAIRRFEIGWTVAPRGRPRVASAT